jgi:uncharacterized membrane protein
VTRPAPTTVLRWLAVVLILRVLGGILANYRDYFPPDFDSDFLRGRGATFAGAYRVAFYAHIITAPVVLLAGLVLLGDAGRRRGLHRALGRVQVGLLLAVVLPSGAVMARHAFGGWPAGSSFVLLSAATAGCAVAGVAAARRGRYARHRRWMRRCYVLVCSAVALRLISGAAEVLGVQSREAAYTAAAWASWLVPLAGYELWERYPPPVRSSAGAGRAGGQTGVTTGGVR